MLWRLKPWTLDEGSLKRLKRPGAQVGLWWKGCRKEPPKPLFSATFSQVQRPMLLCPNSYFVYLLIVKAQRARVSKKKPTWNERRRPGYAPHDTGLETTSVPQLTIYFGFARWTSDAWRGEVPYVLKWGAWSGPGRTPCVTPPRLHALRVVSPQRATGAGLGLILDIIYNSWPPHVRQT